MNKEVFSREVIGTMKRAKKYCKTRPVCIDEKCKFFFICSIGLRLTENTAIYWGKKEMNKIAITLREELLKGGKQ